MSFFRKDLNGYSKIKDEKESIPDTTEDTNLKKVLCFSVLVILLINIVFFSVD